MTRYFRFLFFYLILAALHSIILGSLHLNGILSQDRDYDQRFVFLLVTGSIPVFTGLINLVAATEIKKSNRKLILISLMATAFGFLFSLSLIPFFGSGLNYSLLGSQGLLIGFLVVGRLKSRG